MLDRESLKSISVAILPAKNVRVHFTREVFGRSLNSNEESEVEKKMLFPVFEYELTFSERGWMYLETMKGGGLRKYKEEREIRKNIHASGVFNTKRLRNFYARAVGIRLPVLYWFWEFFSGFSVESFMGRRFRPSKNQKNGFDVSRVKHSFPDGRINFEKISYTKRFSNSVWFPMGYDIKRYADPKTGREARFHRCVRVTDVEFDVEFNAKTFELPEGVDAITRAT